jgi:hypothetical protein
MTPYQFEVAVENDFRNQGFCITHVGKTYDKGVDFIAENEDRRIAVQVKMYENRIVRYQEFMYLYAGQRLYNCTKSILITKNKIDPEAKKVASKLEVDYFENYISHSKIGISKTARQQLEKNRDSDFFELWQKYIKPLKGKTLSTVTGKENLITEVTNDYLFRRSSSGNPSKVEYKIFETIYHRLLEVRSITRDEINTEYTKRASAIITVVLSQIPNIQLIQNPKIELHLIDKI